jgi:hypothetical protein
MHALGKYKVGVSPVAGRLLAGRYVKGVCSGPYKERNLPYYLFYMYPARKKIGPAYSQEDGKVRSDRVSHRSDHLARKP